MQIRHRPPYAIGMGTGAVCVSATAVFLALAGTTAPTASVYRCALAVPVVAIAALFERRRHTSRQRPADIARSVLAGILFAVDVLYWTAAIPEVGAGLSTVLVNAQIVLVPVLARIFGGERIPDRFLLMLPLVLAGVALTGGVLESGGTGDAPVRGTVHALLAALGYSGFLYLLRRGGSAGRPIGTYLVVLTTAAITSAIVGLLQHDLVLAPGRSAMFWLVLVTVCGQLSGWFLVALCSPHLPADAGAALLLLTPVGALILGAVILGQRPGAWQIGGSVLMLAAAYAGTRRGAAEPGLTPDSPRPDARESRPDDRTPRRSAR
ncbi:DMT family transporter [Nocardia sp. BMG111209]|uniref:DMT family transporter n=1 Tax=Nocardia sp. BMG111209 TaxID=1160137 RepID=UPI00039EC376|nr:DMT family transporter [Nocardia sp. BMG111209]